ncbi:RNA polymerase sigma-70 factor, ECF subfamily [Alteromonadaceae bacterium Bs31]|nr:RNA polymerase sigma-70 factor, ECF subfamily [Alteromonadaceae bacterium Bs31]
MSNNKEHVGTLFISIRNKLERVVSHIVPPKEVEDIVQETYVRVCQVEKQDEIQHPRSFMLKVAKNLALDHLKRAETRLVSSIEEDESIEWSMQGSLSDETYNKVAANQEFEHFCEAVRQLPVQCRKAFVLKKVYGYSQKEIASSLQISESTVEKHIASGINRCAKYMSAHGISPKQLKSPRIADRGAKK